MTFANHQAAERFAWLIFTNPAITKPGDIAVGMAIAQSANERYEAWPSNATIAERAHVGHTFVSESIERLKAAGILDWIDRSAKGKGGSNLYTIAALVDDDAQTPSGKRIVSKTRSNRHVPTETDGQRESRERRERNERQRQERLDKERAEAADPAELEQMRAKIARHASASGTVQG
jgi:hypothetical protein